MARKSSNLELIIFNISIAAYELGVVPTVEEVDNELQFVGILKDFWSSYAKFTRTRYTIKLSDEPIWGTWKKGVGYTDGILGMLQNNEANKVHLHVPIGLKDPPGVFTRVLKEETYHILSITAQTSIITFKQNPTINGRCLFMLLASLTVALFTMCSGAAFNTNAITGTIGEQVNNLTDIVRLNKIPVFIDGESMYESFEGGIGKEFKAVYDQAKKFKLNKPVSMLDLMRPLQLTEHECSNGVMILGIRAIKLCYETVELVCSEATKRRVQTYVSPPFHTTAFLSLINPGNNESIGKELIRRDGSFANVMFEKGMGQINNKIANYNSKTMMKRATALYGLKTDWPIQDDSFQIRPLNLSNFALIFESMTFLELVILLCNVLYQIFNFASRRVKWTMPVSSV
uniref:Ionotropic glutamate receptor C-terminal domain-containing protein n=1 Tax=Tetranychus urticae TaxID=32264 RepID=T1KNY0_TETUR